MINLSNKGAKVDLQALKDAILSAIKKKKTIEVGNFLISFSTLNREDFFGERSINIVGWRLTDLFTVLQGVTWGGRNCQKIYVVDEETVRSNHLEQELIYKTIGGKDIEPFSITWRRTFLVFPYRKEENSNSWIRAFQVKNRDADYLDPSINFPERKKEALIWNPKEKLLSRLGIIPYPNVARWLIDNYDKLSSREFEGKRLIEYGKLWYEYHRPRKPILLTTPKIVGARLMKTPKFAIDEEGYLPRDSVVSLIPVRNKRFPEFMEYLSKLIGRKITVLEALNYCLCVLNSFIFQSLLDEVIDKRKGGYVIIGEKLLSKMVIPKPDLSSKEILLEMIENPRETDLVNELLLSGSSEEQVKLSSFAGEPSE